MEYIGVIHKDNNSDYSVSFPDFPGCITAGSTVEEAKEMAKEALQFHIDGLTEDEEYIPEPSDFTTIKKGEEYPENVHAYFFVHVKLPRKEAIRINTTFDPELLVAIDAKAKELGMTRSGFLAKAARELLD